MVVAMLYGIKVWNSSGVIVIYIYIYIDVCFKY